MDVEIHLEEPDIEEQDETLLSPCYMTDDDYEKTSSLLRFSSLYTTSNDGSPSPIKMPRLVMITTISLGCLVSVWLVVNLSIPSLKKVTLLGSFLWKWALLWTILFLGYPLLLICSIIMRKLIPCLYSKFRGSNAEYYLKGLEASMALLIYFALILLTWLLCIRSNNHGLNRYGMLTLVSLMAGGFLSVLKSVFLLWWETTFIFKRHKGNILVAGVQFHHLLILCAPWLKVTDVRDLMKATNGHWTDRAFDDLNSKVNSNDEDYVGTKPLEAYMLSKRMRLQDINDVVTWLTTNFHVLFTTDRSAISKFIIYMLQEVEPSDACDGEDVKRMIVQMLAGNEIGWRDYIDEDLEATKFVKTLRIVNFLSLEENVTREHLQKWLVNGPDDSLLLRLKLIGAIERMKNLDRVLTGSIAVLVIVIWLFITGVATTKVVVALASLFLGLSFMFADACKAFFLGLTFTFVIHSFDVGDRCVINGIELLVKRVNVLTTIFENQEKDTVIYPNSDLATRNITKLWSERKKPKQPAAVDKEEFIELHLDSTVTTPQIRRLLQLITGTLRDGTQRGQFSSTYDITVEENGENFKMTIPFKHNPANGDVSEKKIQRSTLVLLIKEHLENVTSGNDQV